MKFISFKYRNDYTAETKRSVPPLRDIISRVTRNVKKGYMKLIILETKKWRSREEEVEKLMGHSGK
ncbi:hypothetical protein HS1genome_0742 [Sulfodiicoccus acidiphilus]|uniref:Uncharacterized protein n=1 Tax=Sulfodiicoccus acidiphilus TaxID=1670455 RepID=A0A348B2F1_9CREN|nr:hypothetical protein HS1genome_0742 [Sulfodiicoccus acidiphilus]GGT90083.1 hypothetical protein GCM10007116_04800 [Sulfodiicoccus acidiphilus]